MAREIRDTTDNDNNQTSEQKPAMHLTYDYYFRYGCVSDGGAGWIVPHVY